MPERVTSGRPCTARFALATILRLPCLRLRSRCSSSARLRKQQSVVASDDVFVALARFSDQSSPWASRPDLTSTRSCVRAFRRFSFGGVSPMLPASTRRPQPFARVRRRLSFQCLPLLKPVRNLNCRLSPSMHLNKSGRLPPVRPNPLRRVTARGTTRRTGTDAAGQARARRRQPAWRHRRAPA